MICPEARRPDLTLIPEPEGTTKRHPEIPWR
jgi:hypothetical protein